MPNGMSSALCFPPLLTFGFAAPPSKEEGGAALRDGLEAEKGSRPPVAETTDGYQRSKFPCALARPLF